MSVVGAAELFALGAVEMRLAALQRPAAVGVDRFGQRPVFAATPMGREHQPVARIVEDVERAGEIGQQVARRRLQHRIGIDMVAGALQHVGHFEQPPHLLARGIGRLDRRGAAIGLRHGGAEGVDEPENGEEAAADLQDQHQQRAVADALLVQPEAGIGLAPEDLQPRRECQHRFGRAALGEERIGACPVAHGAEMQRLVPGGVERRDERGGPLRRAQSLDGDRREFGEDGGGIAGEILDARIVVGQRSWLAGQHMLHIGIGLDQRLLHVAQLPALLAQRCQRLLLAPHVVEAVERRANDRGDEQDRCDAQHARAHRHGRQLVAADGSEQARKHGSTKPRRCRFRPYCPSLRQPRAAIGESA